MLQVLESHIYLIMQQQLTCVDKDGLFSTKENINILIYTQANN
jgi:hypothetical protein